MTSSHPMGVGDVLCLAERTELSVVEVVYRSTNGRSLLKVRNDSDGLFYALKVFDNPGKDNEMRREMVALNRQNQHPHLFPRCRGYYEQEGKGYLRLDWMDGVTFAKSFGGTPSSVTDLKFRVEALIELCNTVGILHRNRYVHRDLKPENILLRNPRRISDGVSIIDFGLAAQSRSDTEGTPGYSAPEQWLRRDYRLTQAVDVYSVGQIGFFLVLGAPLALYPNDAGSGWSRSNAGVVTTGCEFAPQKLEEALERAIAFRPEDRFLGIQELRAALRNVRMGC